jgi:hypothetical protein
MFKLLNFKDFKFVSNKFLGGVGAAQIWYIFPYFPAIPVLKSAANTVLDAPGCQQSHETFHKYCDILLKCTTKIKESVLGKSSPDLLDPVRQNVRPLHGNNQGMCDLFYWSPLD